MSLSFLFFFLYSLKSLFGTRIKFLCIYVCMYVLHSFLTIPDNINIIKVQQTLYILHVQCTYQFFFEYCKITRSENFTLQLCKICTCNTIVSFWSSMILLFTITIQIVAEKQKFRKTPFNYAQKKNHLMRSKVGTVLHTVQCIPMYGKALWHNTTCLCFKSISWGQRWSQSSLFETLDHGL